MKVLITGSRGMSQEMELAVTYAVHRIYEQHHTVICGDAEGVDNLVIEKCDLWRVFVNVYGAYNKIKRTSSQSSNSTATITTGDYLARDRRMAEVCDMCIAIWDCSSRGTKYTYDYCLKLSKPAVIYAIPPNADYDLVKNLLKLC